MFKAFALALFSLTPATSQVFDVASIRPAVRVVGAREKIDARPGNLTMRGVRIRACIMWAYSVKDYQIAGPEWLGSPGWLGRDIDIYDVTAKAPEGTPVPEMRRMLQALLADRFKLAVHRENKEVPGYALVAGKKGPGKGLRPSNADSKEERTQKQAKFTMGRITLSEFADFLAGPVKAPVVNETALPGPYDITIDMTPDEELNANRDDQDYALRSAMDKQLGLALIKASVPLEMLVVDHIEKIPTEN